MLHYLSVGFGAPDLDLAYVFAPPGLPTLPGMTRLQTGRTAVRSVLHFISPTVSGQPVDGRWRRLDRDGALRQVGGMKDDQEDDRAAMTKSELISRLADTHPHLYHRDIERIVTAIFDEISTALARGDRVELRGFGAFSVKHRDAREGRNPRTGAKVSVPDKALPFFKAGKLMRDLVNAKSGGK